MFKNLKWIRIVPDSPGKGGIKSGFHSFQAQPLNDTRNVQGFHVYQGRWRLDYQTQAVPATTADPNGVQALALHSYPVVNLSDPSATPTITLLGHHIGAADQHYYQFTHTAGVRDSHAQTTNPFPATFLNIEGRCFAADGAREGFIMDDRTAAIHTQANQNLGIGTPTMPLQNYDDNVTPYGTAYCYNGSYYINHPNPKNRLGTVITTDAVNLSFPNVSHGEYAGALPTAGLPTTDAVSSDVTPFAATGTISITTGTSLVTLAGATWPANFQYCGLSINFNGYSFVIAEHGVQASAYNIDGTQTGWTGAPALSNVQLMILGVYDGPTITGATYTITGCQVGPLSPGVANTSSATMVDTGTLGYSQTTASNLVQVQVLVHQLNGTGSWRNLGNISLGPESIDGAATGSIESITDGSIKGVPPRKVLTSASNPWAAEDVGLSIFVDEADSSGGILTTTISAFIGAGSVRLGAANESGVDIAGTGQAWWGSGPVVADGAMGIGDNTLTSASNPFVAGDVGQPIVVEFAGNNGGTISLITTIATFNNAGSVELTLANQNAGAVSAARVWWRGISVDTNVGPKYTYAWYDPETGHMSNVAPLYQVPRPTEIGSYVDFAYITPVFRIDPGYISYPTTTDGIRFSHIMFFRTLSNPNSSTLYPIGSLQPFVGKVHPGATSTRGSWSPSTYHGWMGLPNNYAPVPPNTMGTPPNLWYDWSSDEDLLLSGGFRAPQYTNSKPMALLRGGMTEPAKVAYQAYWDRRLWTVATQEPDKIMFSCDEAQCPLGVPVESFPPTNYLRIPSVDGQVVGMKTVGDMLLITTQRWAYTIAGNNESNYRLLRISTRMGGVGTYQMSELTSDVEGQQSVVYFLGRDKIVYEWVPGSAVKPISAPVQDIIKDSITDLASYRNSRLHCLSAYGRRLVVLSLMPVLGYHRALAFDVDNRIWTRWYEDNGATLNGAAAQAFATVHSSDPPIWELYSHRLPGAPTIGVKSWIRDDGQVQASTGVNSISTFPLDFDGIKKRKQLVVVNAHISNAVSGTWNCQVSVNESPTLSAGADFTSFPQDTLYSLYGPTPSPVDSADAADLAVLTAAFTADPAGVLETAHPLIGYRFVVTLTTSPVTTGGFYASASELYAIDIGYIDWEEQGEADP